MIKKIFSAIMALSMFALLSVPFGTRAISVNSSEISGYSIEQLQTLIAKLQAQLEEMKKGSLCMVSTADLSLGDGEGGEMTDDVRRLQDFLREKGVFSYGSTGYFGKVTQRALKAFQKSQGLSESGAFDAATREKAHSLFCKKVSKQRFTNEEDKYKKEVEAKKVEDKKKEISQVGGVKSILLMTKEKGVVWKVDGNSVYGFKIVYSKNQGPTYPTREGDKYIYLDNSGSRDTYLEAFNGSGTYYVRTCEYLGGKCGVYSNEVKIDL